MKKHYIAILFLLVFFSSKVFCQEAEQQSNKDQNELEITELIVEEPSFCFSSGLSLSIYGFGPSLGFNLKKFEMATELFVGKSKITPKLTLGYNTNPFYQGHQHLFGLACVKKEAFTSSKETYTASNEDFLETHLIGFIYRYSYRVKLGLSAGFSMMLPLNWNYLLYPFLTTTVGIRYSF